MKKHRNSATLAAGPPKRTSEGEEGRTIVTGASLTSVRTIRLNLTR